MSQGTLHEGDRLFMNYRNLLCLVCLWWEAFPSRTDPSFKRIYVANTEIRNLSMSLPLPSDKYSSPLLTLHFRAFILCGRPWLFIHFHNTCGSMISVFLQKRKLWHTKDKQLTSNSSHCVSEGVNKDQNFLKTVPFLLNATLLGGDSFLFSDLLMAPGVLLSFIFFWETSQHRLAAVPNQAASCLERRSHSQKTPLFGLPGQGRMKTPSLRASQWGTPLLTPPPPPLSLQPFIQKGPHRITQR